MKEHKVPYNVFSYKNIKFLTILALDKLGITNKLQNIENQWRKENYLALKWLGILNFCKKKHCKAHCVHSYSNIKF